MANHTREDATITAGTKQKGNVWIFCADCGQPTNHGVVAYADEHDRSTDGDIQVWTSYQVVRCHGCFRVSFREASQNTEDEEWDAFDGTVTLSVTERLFPKTLQGRTKLAGSWRLPDRVERVYDETLEAAANDLRVLAGIGIRALVESVCSAKGAKGNLEKQIDSLQAMGMLSSEEATLLHGTRLLGNSAAHEAVPLTQESLAAALDVAEHLLNSAFLIAKRGADLPKPKPRATATKSKAAKTGSTKPKPKPK